MRADAAISLQEPEQYTFNFRTGKPMRQLIGLREQKVRRNEGAWPGATTLAWEDDPVAQALVEVDGAMTTTRVAACLGMSRDRVRQVELHALNKLRAAIELAGNAEELRKHILDKLAQDPDNVAGFVRVRRRAGR